MKDQGSKVWKRENVKARNAKRSRVLAVPKGVYKGFRESDKPLRWGEWQDEMTLIDRNQSEAVQ
jgi:hypothetical protein